MTEQFRILDAFVDGESVDPSALRQALADEAGRDYLIDAWLLRDLVQEEIADDVVPTPARTATRTATPPGRRWLAAAAVAAVCLTGGYLAGTRFPGTFATDSAPPSNPVATASPAPAVTTPAPVPAGGVTAPPATRVIRLELDPNWKETAGGR